MVAGDEGACRSPPNYDGGARRELDCSPARPSSMLPAGSELGCCERQAELLEELAGSGFGVGLRRVGQQGGIAAVFLQGVSQLGRDNGQVLASSLRVARLCAPFQLFRDRGGVDRTQLVHVEVRTELCPDRISRDTLGRRDRFAVTPHDALSQQAGGSGTRRQKSCAPERLLAAHLALVAFPTSEQATEQAHACVPTRIVSDEAGRGYWRRYTPPLVRRDEPIDEQVLGGVRRERRRSSPCKSCAGRARLRPHSRLKGSSAHSPRRRA